VGGLLNGDQHDQAEAAAAMPADTELIGGRR
jgi:hypothetical protein